MNFLQSDKKTITLFFLIYLIANFFLLLNYDGIYFDDWALYNHSFDIIYNMFSQVMGNAGIFVSFLHYSLLKLGVFSYRILTFFLLFLCGIFVYKILKTLNFISHQDRFFVTLLFLLAPLYSAKVALIVFPYTFCITLFFFGFYLLSEYLKNLGIIKRIFILIIFFISFLTNSILVFYLVVLIYIFYKLYNVNFSFFFNIKTFIIKKIDFIILPIIFWIIKYIYFLPTGLYSDYNIISFKLMFSSPIYFLFVFYKNFILSLEKALDLILFIWPLILLLFIFFYNYSNNEKKVNNCPKISFLLILLGLFFFFLGAFPYISVGKFPDDIDWSSRHQLLLPLGFSFILYFGLKTLSEILSIKKNMFDFILIVFAIAFVGIQLKDGINYNIDWIYQQSIKYNFLESEVVKKHTTFIVRTSIGDKLAKGRIFRFYELNGISKEAFAEDNRYFVNSENEIELYKMYKPYKQYNFSKWQYENPVCIEILKNEKQKELDGITKFIALIKFKYYQIFDKEKYYQRVKQLIFIKGCS